MPPKQRFNKAMVLEAALKITREAGFEAVNARSLAAALNCSTAPIYSYCSNMDELKKELLDFAIRQFMDSINQHKDDPDFLSYTNYILVHTALHDSHFFRFIYLSHSHDGESLYNLLMKYETHRFILAHICTKYGLSHEQGRDVFYKLWFLVFGISAFLSTNQVDTTEEEVLGIIGQAATAILREAQMERMEKK